jgi:hypothetical protein
MNGFAAGVGLSSAQQQPIQQPVQQSQNQSINLSKADEVQVVNLNKEDTQTISLAKQDSVEKTADELVNKLTNENTENHGVSLQKN